MSITYFLTWWVNGELLSRPFHPAPFSPPKSLNESLLSLSLSFPEQ